MSDRTVPPRTCMGPASCMLPPRCVHASRETTSLTSPGRIGASWGRSEAAMGASWAGLVPSGAV
eukprot:5124154-Pyramimonas_sp.AAC.1